ncbi:hypothetical protein HDU79_007778 [Rhizoclosmatium sp. JEL0117]|nr:hypothetical protein HDU79_007778 [Rhizoclosmatium sp. JEL0117]
MVLEEAIKKADDELSKATIYVVYFLLNKQSTTVRYDSEPQYQREIKLQYSLGPIGWSSSSSEKEREFTIHVQHDELMQYPLIQQISGGTKLPATYVVEVLLVSMVVSMLLQVGHLFITNLVASIIPAVLFMNASRDVNVHKIKALGFYFLVVAAINLVEELLQERHLDAYIPRIWWFTKLTLVVWMFWFDGAEILYEPVQSEWLRIRQHVPVLELKNDGAIVD